MGLVTVRLAPTGVGNAIEGATESGGRFAFDGEGGGFGPTPMETLLASVGACTLLHVAIILRKKRLDVANLRIECAGEQVSEGHPRPFEAIRLVLRADGGVRQDVLDDCLKLVVAKYCNVGATLEHGVPIAFEAHAGGPGAQTPGVESVKSP